MQAETEIVFNASEIIESLSKALEEFNQAMLKYADKLVTAFEPFMEAVVSMCFEIQRYLIFVHLYHYLPPRLSWWVAWHWPRRFLPVFAFKKRLTET